MTFRHPLPLLLLFLAGCAGVTQPGADQGRLVLRQAITIPPHAATLRLQYGRATASNAVQEYDPFCIFELDTVSTTPQAVAPASFPITGIARSVEAFSGMPVAGFVPMWASHDDSPSQIYYKTTFRLADPGGPVRALTCLSDQNTPGNAPIMRHLTLEQMRAALGSAFALELHGAP